MEVAAEYSGGKPSDALGKSVESAQGADAKTHG